MAQNLASLPYHEPGIVIILVQASFLLLLNIVNTALDRLLYCGLLGQVLIGIAWGTPGTKWLSVNTEETIVQLGYLGLILLVYEAWTAAYSLLETGGLNTSFPSLKANLLLSSGVALTGIAVPIGLSYTLQGILGATPVQAFAAGAALCSTSLGTTFTVLASSRLSHSRLGVVLTSAAMMDDVVGLVMVQVISNLGGDDFSWVTVVRPVLVSVAFAVTVPLICLFIIKPLTIALNSYRERRPMARFNASLRKPQTVFTIHTLLLIGLVAGATYAGTSNLFAAYIAGATTSWWDSEVPHPNMMTQEPSARRTNETTGGSPSDAASRPRRSQSLHAEDDADSNSSRSMAQNPPMVTAESAEEHKTRGSALYQHYYHPAVSKILQPLFFASIGFPIPITRMFDGAIIWRGIVYALLMAFAKLLCGLWLIRFTFALDKGTAGRMLAKLRLPSAPHFWGKSEGMKCSKQVRVPNSNETISSAAATAERQEEPRTSPNPPKPLSLHPPLILALAMCSRGEIGFLISGVAESKGIFSVGGHASDEPSDIFIVVSWAIVLCTMIGPLGVGLAVRRVRTLQERRNEGQEGSGKDVLGVWGVG